MRFLSALLLSLCCFIAVAKSNAVDIPVQQAKATSEYKAIQTTLPAQALNDYHTISSLFSNGIHSTSKTDAPYPENIDGANHLPVYTKDTFKSKHLLFPGDHAKIFIAKLIFPQHYHW